MPKRPHAKTKSDSMDQVIFKIIYFVNLSPRLKALIVLKPIMLILFQSLLNKFPRTGAANTWMYCNASVRRVDYGDLVVTRRRAEQFFLDQI